MKIKVGDPAPEFNLKSHLDKDVTLSEYRGKTTVLVFFPQAFTPVWTSQIPSYEAEYAAFAELDVQVLGISVDHIPVLKAWAESLGGISYPLISDFWPHGEIAKEYGAFRELEGRSERAIFIIDKDGIVQYVDIHDIDEQPDNEVLFQEIRRIQPDHKPIKAPEEKKAEDELDLEGVVLFCNKWCPGCRRARIWFEDKKIEYTEYDVTRNQAAAKQVKEWTGGNLTTPTFYINGEVVVDWKIEEVSRLLL